MDDRDELVAALEAAGCTVRGKAVRCAFHDDRNDSGSIHQYGDGRWRYRCHACGVRGDAADIIALHTGRPVAEILRDRRDQEKPMQTRPVRPEPEPQRWPDLEALVAHFGSRVVAVYKYAHPTTHAVELAVLRMPDKKFLQASPAPGGGWWLKRPLGALPVYNRARIAAAEVVLLCEGEKDVHALHELGFVGTTFPMGADDMKVSIDSDGKPGLADASPLAGKHVVLVGDNDEPGRRHMQRVERILGRLHPRPILRRAFMEDMQGAKDVADLIAAQPSTEAARVAIQRMIDNSRVIHAAAPLHRRIEDAIAGKLSAVPWPWPSVGGLTQALLPGALTILGGSPGATKSFTLMQAALWWQACGYRVAVYELEEDAAYWLNRALALVSGIGAVTDPAWLAMNPDQARALLAKHHVELDAFAAAMTVASAEGVSLPGLAEWVERSAASGARIIVADPVTAAIEDDDKPWVAAQKFMLRAKRAIASAGASLVFASHPRKGDARGGKVTPDLDSIAGGAAFGRFASTVFWIEAMAEAEGVTVVDADGRLTTADANRRLRILKSRNGRGAGLTIAMHFDVSRLSTCELGVIASSSAQAQRAERVQSGRRHHRKRPVPDEDLWQEARR